MSTDREAGNGAAGPLVGDGDTWLRVESVAAEMWPVSAEHDFLAVLPAATSAAAARRPFVAGWLCRGPGEPLELITNAVISTSGEAGPGGDGHAEALGQRTLLFPPAARGVPPRQGWREAWDSLVWTPCLGRPALPLPGEDRQTSDDLSRPTRFERALATLIGRPFGWLVVAEPTGDLDAEIDALRTQVNVLRSRDEEGSRFSTSRAERRLAELDTFGEAGLWSLRVLVGAQAAAELAVIAPVLAGSVELSHQPYRLVPVPAAMPLADALTAQPQDPERDARSPFQTTAGLLTPLAGLPRRELPGLRVTDSGYFDLTSETPDRGMADVADAVQVGLGSILDGQDRAVGEFRVPLSTLNRHTFVTGATGTGKSQTVRHLLEQLSAAGVPWLVIEPVKSEYAAMAGRLGGNGPVTVVNPVDPESVPLSVNPLAPEPGYPVQAHIDMVRALFMAAFDADEPFPQIMAQALQRVYEDNGWDVVTGGRMPDAAADPVVPTLTQLRNAALAVIDDVGYGRELQADVRGFVDVRLRSLRVGSAGRFFEGGHPVDITELLSRNIVLAIEDVANDEDKAFLMGTLIIRIVEHLRLRARAGQAGQLRHVIVIEEAHRLLRAGREGRASAHAVELFAGMLAEIRAYGEGLVVAEQIPAKLIPDVVKNTALKIVHRLPARDDRDLVGAAMNLNADQSRHVVALPPGVAAVFADGMDRPLRVRVPFGGDREVARPGPVPPVSGRRSTACGPACVAGQPCTLRELRHAEVLASASQTAETWLRVWAEILVLGLLTNRPLPAVPPAVRHEWDGMTPRTRECMLATVIDQAVGVRSAALRGSYTPARLAESAAGVALRMLDHRAHSGIRTGPTWVIPQLRWLHEMEKVSPGDGGPADRAALAPPLDFDLPGLSDWPGMRVGHRIRALREHPTSPEALHNRMPAWTALLGEDDQRAFSQDVAVIGVGLPPARQLIHVAGLMDVSPWLEVVLSWPRRFVACDEWPDAHWPDGALDGTRVGAVPDCGVADRSVPVGAVPDSEWPSGQPAEWPDGLAVAGPPMDVVVPNPRSASPPAGSPRAGG